MTTSVSPNRSRITDRRTGLGLTWSNYLGQSAAGTWPYVGGSYKRFDDVASRDFHTRVKKGEIVMNYMSSISSTVSGSVLAQPEYATEPWITPKRWARYGGDTWALCTGKAFEQPWTDLMLSTIPDSEVDRLKVEISTRCLSQIGRGDANNWENLAEAGKTLDLLKHPFASWFKFEKKARIATAGLSAANAWLAYRYGVKPLISSVDATLKSLEKRLTKPSRTTTRASGVITRRIDDVIETTNQWHGEAKFIVARQRTETVNVRAVSIDETILDSLTAYGLSTKDLLTLPWELVPWSFVVDWFLNVGDFLGAMTQYLSPASKGRCLTVERIRSEYRETQSAVSWNPASIEVLVQGKGTQRTDVTLRTRQPALSTPGIVRKADFRLDSATRMGDAAALVGQQILQSFTNRR